MGGVNFRLQGRNGDENCVAELLAFPLLLFLKKKEDSSLHAFYGKKHNVPPSPLQKKQLKSYQSFQDEVRQLGFTKSTLSNCIRSFNYLCL